MKKLPVLVVWMAAIASGCSDAPMERWSGAIDTLPSGAVVVTNERAASSPGEFWHLEEVVRIGAPNGVGPEVFGRIADVEIGPDGNIYVVDQQAAEVRSFDLEGNHVRTIGREGEGPGEFQSPSAAAFSPSGVLWVADGQRYTSFGREGELRNVYTTGIRGSLRPGQLRAPVEGQLVDLAFLRVREDGVDGSVRVRGLGPGAVVWSFSDSAVLVDSVAFGDDWRPPSLTQTRGGTTTSMVVPEAPQRVFEPSERDIIWTGIGDDYAVHAVTMEGDTVLTVRREVSPEPLTEGDSDRLHRWLERMGEQGFATDRSQLPQYYPFFDRIVAADDGTVWLYREWAEGGFFDVFDESGRYLGEVRTHLNAGPFGTHPSISGEHVAGVVLDSLDVPRVEVFRIVRN